MGTISVLADTSAYSAFMAGHPDVKRALQLADAIYLTPIVLGELRAGFLRGRSRKKNEEELRAFLASPRVDVVDITEATAERYAAILDFLWKSGAPIPTNDIWIAASAMQHGLKLLTTDTHYAKVPHVVSECFTV
ncbi:MAG TPA: type II toxin-antitoxin system VapC family toxin [bacterium]|nr:type II toxin-antitoxin system VapC family toxin [bacterium]